MGELKEKTIYKLATVTGIDMNAVAATALFTVPLGKHCIITHIVIYNATVSLDTANFGFGFAAGEDDVIAAAVHAGLTGADLCEVIKSMAGAAIGQDDGEVLSIGVDIAQGVAAEMDVDVFGYLF